MQWSTMKYFFGKSGSEARINTVVYVFILFSLLFFLVTNDICTYIFKWHLIYICYCIALYLFHIRPLMLGISGGKWIHNKYIFHRCIKYFCKSINSRKCCMDWIIANTCNSFQFHSQCQWFFKSDLDLNLI